MTITLDNFKRINKAVLFINDNPSQDLSLEKLARLANYSPFHFQKLFKSVQGETPKQYILRIRLETAAHLLVMFPDKSITEIALDYGFSSSATFARAFKNHFGISAQEMRHSSAEERLQMCRKSEGLVKAENFFLNFRSTPNETENSLNVIIKRTETIRGIFVNASLDSEAEIEAALKKVAQLADVNDLLTEHTKFVGIIYMHQNIYQAIATIEPFQQAAKDLNLKEITAGKFATFKVKGDIKQTFKKLYDFNKNWIPNSGYQISDIVGFEILCANPFDNPYHETERDIYIPIRPSR
jgi:AraC family transcriptional regulator